MRIQLTAAVGALLCAAWWGGSAPAGAADPAIDVPAARLRASLHCQRAVRDARRTPILLVTGTGVDGREAWPGGLQRSLTVDGWPTCYVDFPEHTTGDIQVAAEYLVAAIRSTARRAGRPIGIYGVSQGGLLPRWALTYWPSLRPLVADVVAVSGTQHGTTTFESLLAACGSDCRFTAAAWQQAAGSRLETALARYPDETPGRTAWSTVRSLFDEVVQPVDGPRPTAALRGATNVLIQDVCPGREVNHIATSSDSVSYAVLIDAVTHAGPANVRRLPAAVCDHPFAPGLDEQATRAGIDAIYALATPRVLEGADGGRLLPREPPVRRYARR